MADLSNLVLTLESLRHSVLFQYSDWDEMERMKKLRQSLGDVRVGDLGVN